MNNTRASHHSHYHNWRNGVQGGEFTDEHQAAAFDLRHRKSPSVLQRVFVPRVHSFINDKLIWACFPLCIPGRKLHLSSPAKAQLLLLQLKMGLNKGRNSRHSRIASNFGNFGSCPSLFYQKQNSQDSEQSWWFGVILPVWSFFFFSFLNKDCKHEFFIFVLLRLLPSVLFLLCLADRYFWVALVFFFSQHFEKTTNHWS